MTNETEIFGENEELDFEWLYASQEPIIVGKTQRELEEEQKIADELERQRIEADKEARKTAEIEFRQRMKEDFLLANPFGTEADFKRLYPTLRDNSMIENLRKFQR